MPGRRFLVLACVAIVAACNLTSVTLPSAGGPTSQPVQPGVTTPAPLPTQPTMPTPGLPTTPPAPPAADILGHIPADIAATCERMPVAYAGSIDGAECRPSSGAAVVYYVRFGDQASMDAAFDDQWTSEAPEAENGGLCDAADAGVGTVNHPTGGAGRYLCMRSPVLDAWWLYWTSQTTNVLSYAAVDGAAIDPLLDWWEVAGPIQAIGGQPPVSQPTPQPPVSQPTPQPVDPGQPPVDPGDMVAVCGGPSPDPLTVNDLIGGWGYDTGTYYWAEDYADANVTGSFHLGADMRWDGSRDYSMGGQTMVVSAYGPGSWTFDGYVLTLHYDDGSDSDTFDKVRIAPPGPGQSRATMTLQVSYADGSCIIYKLAQI